MPLSNLKGPSIERIQKSPLGYIMMIMGALIALFARGMFDNSKQQLKDKDTIIAAYQKREDQYSRKCDSVAGFWQSKYLIELESNSQELKRLQEEREKLKTPTQKLLKAIKKSKNE